MSDNFMDIWERMLIRERLMREKPKRVKSIIREAAKRKVLKEKINGTKNSSSRKRISEMIARRKRINEMIAKRKKINGTKNSLSRKRISEKLARRKRINEMIAKRKRINGTKNSLVKGRINEKLAKRKRIKELIESRKKQNKNLIGRIVVEEKTGKAFTIIDVKPTSYLLEDKKGRRFIIKKSLFKLA